MNTIGTLHPTDQVPFPSFDIGTILLTGGSSGQALDLPAGANVCRITPMTTAGTAFSVFATFKSTVAAVPSSGVTTGSSASTPIMVPMTFQIPGGSTGISIASYSSGLAIVEFWRR